MIPTKVSFLPEQLKKKVSASEILEWSEVFNAKNCFAVLILGKLSLWNTFEWASWL